jgi:hypothetical protein
VDIRKVRTVFCDSGEQHFHDAGDSSLEVFLPVVLASIEEFHTVVDVYLDHIKTMNKDMVK